MASITPPPAAAANASAAPAGGAYRWYVVGVLSLAYAFSAIDARVLTLLVTPIKASMKLSDFEISLLQGFNIKGHDSLNNLIAKVNEEFDLKFASPRRLVGVQRGEAVAHRA